jgi:hypothetical protein
MADRKEKKRGSTDETAGKHMSESSPNPHGENKVLEMPIRTDQRGETDGQNVAQNPNTIGGRLNPSVAHEFKPRSGALKTGGSKSGGSKPGSSKSEPSSAKRPGIHKSGHRDPFQRDAKEQKRRGPTD